MSESSSSRIDHMSTWQSATSWAVDLGPDRAINLKEYLSTLAEYLGLSILQPNSLQSDIFPTPVPIESFVTSPSRSRNTKAPRLVDPAAKPRTDDEDEHASATQLLEEQFAAYRIDGLGGLAYILEDSKARGGKVQIPDDLRNLVTDEHLWSALSPSPPEEDGVSLGHAQPVIRQQAYRLLELLVKQFPDDIRTSIECLPSAIMSSCWIEEDAGVWGKAAPALSRYLLGESHEYCLMSSLQIFRSAGNQQRAEQSQGNPLRHPNPTRMNDPFRVPKTKP